MAGQEQNHGNERSLFPLQSQNLIDSIEPHPRDLRSRQPPSSGRTLHLPQRTDFLLRPGKLFRIKSAGCEQ